MPSMSASTVLGILTCSNNKDALELSKSQGKIRKLYERNRLHYVYQIFVKQSLEEDAYILTIKNTFLQCSSESYSLNMDELKKRLLQYCPTSLKLEISDLATSELLDFLPKEWINSVKNIDIICLQSENLDYEATEAVRRKLKTLVREFGTIDNIMFRRNEITTSAYDQVHLTSWWFRRQKTQTRGFRIRYEKLNISGTDVEEILLVSALSTSGPMAVFINYPEATPRSKMYTTSQAGTCNLSQYFNLWLNGKSGDLNDEIEEFLDTIDNNNGPRRFMLNNTRITKLKAYAEENLFPKSCLVYLIQLSMVFWNRPKKHEAVQFSRCQMSIRKCYERKRKLCVHRLNLKQPVLDDDKYTLAVKRSRLPFPCEHHCLNLDELKKKLLGLSPTWVKFEISDLATARLLGFLPEEWFDSIQYIEIRCLETDKLNSEAVEAMKSKIKNLLRRFGTIDNIMVIQRVIEQSERYLCSLSSQAMGHLLNKELGERFEQLIKIYAKKLVSDKNDEYKTCKWIFEPFYRFIELN